MIVVANGDQLSWKKTERERERDLEKAPKGNPSKLADRAELGIFAFLERAKKNRKRRTTRILR
jgi:hypothetical protein